MICSFCQKDKWIEFTLIWDKEYYFCSKACLIAFLLKKRHPSYQKLVRKLVKEEVIRYLDKEIEEISKDIIRKAIFDKEIIDELCSLVKKRLGIR